MHMLMPFFFNLFYGFFQYTITVCSIRDYFDVNYYMCTYISNTIITHYLIFSLRLGEWMLEKLNENIWFEISLNDLFELWGNCSWGELLLLLLLLVLYTIIVFRGCN